MQLATSRGLQLVASINVVPGCALEVAGGNHQHAAYWFGSTPE